MSLSSILWICCLFIYWKLSNLGNYWGPSTLAWETCIRASVSPWGCDEENHWRSNVTRSWAWSWQVILVEHNRCLSLSLSLSLAVCARLCACMCLCKCQCLCAVFYRYLFLFLKFVASVIPTIEYDYTMDFDLGSSSTWFEGEFGLTEALLI